VAAVGVAAAEAAVAAEVAVVGVAEAEAAADAEDKRTVNEGN